MKDIDQFRCQISEKDTINRDFKKPVICERSIF